MTGPLELMVVFFATAGIVWAAGYGFLRWAESPLRQTAEPPVVIVEPVLPSTQDFLAQAFRAVGEQLPGGKETSNPIRRLLVQAGYRYPSALPIFYGIKLASAAGLGILFAWIGFINGSEAGSILLGLICGVGFGFLLPDRLLTPLIRARMARIRRGIPAALDLMVLAVEAGQSLNQALLDVSQELREAFPVLAGELAQVHMELRAGKARTEALYELGERNHEPELKKLANVLIDADRFGTRLGPALRSHAKYLRSRTRQQAQEAARKVGVKLVFPVFFLIFPSVLLVTLAPAIMKLMQQLKSYLQ